MIDSYKDYFKLEAKMKTDTNPEIPKFYKMVFRDELIEPGDTPLCMDGNTFYLDYKFHGLTADEAFVSYRKAFPDRALYCFIRRILTPEELQDKEKRTHPEKYSPAFPNSIWETQIGEQFQITHLGLTKREYAAITIYTGIVDVVMSDQGSISQILKSGKTNRQLYETLAEQALVATDALLEKLND